MRAGVAELLQLGTRFLGLLLSLGVEGALGRRAQTVSKEPERTNEAIWHFPAMCVRCGRAPLPEMNKRVHMHRVVSSISTPWCSARGV